MLAGQNSKRESAPKPLAIIHHSRYAKEPALSGGLFPDRSGYPEDTSECGSDGFDVNGFRTFASFTEFEFNLLSINQRATA